MIKNNPWLYIINTSYTYKNISAIGAIKLQSVKIVYGLHTILRWKHLCNDIFERVLNIWNCCIHINILKLHSNPHLLLSVTFKKSVSFVKEWHWISRNKRNVFNFPIKANKTAVPKLLSVPYSLRGFVYISMSSHLINPLPSMLTFFRQSCY